MGISRNISWSITRSRTMTECPRKFFYEYYADGEPEAYHAWNLKEIITLPMLAGEVVDLVIAAALKRVSRGEVLPTNMADVGTRTFQKLLDGSSRVVANMKQRARSTDARRKSEYRALHHHWYAMDLGTQYEDRLKEQVRTSLEHFETSQVLQKILSVNPSNWGPFTRSMRTRPFFSIDGFRVYTSFDFYFVEDENLYLLDWKTGSSQYKESANQQLAVYALYAVHELRFEPDKLFVQAVWLQDHGMWEPQQVGADELSMAEEYIRSEVKRERALISYNESDKSWKADRSVFLARPSVRNCTYCKFRDICPEGRLICDHIQSFRLAKSF